MVGIDLELVADARRAERGNHVLPVSGDGLLDRSPGELRHAAFLPRLCAVGHLPLARKGLRLVEEMGGGRCRRDNDRHQGRQRHLEVFEHSCHIAHYTISTRLRSNEAATTLQRNRKKSRFYRNL